MSETDQNKAKQLINKYAHITKRSHFVKQEYLKNWSPKNSKVFVSINNGTFHEQDTDSICHERYMYKLEMLTNNKIIQLKHFYAKCSQIVRKVNDDFLLDWQFLCTLSKNIENQNAGDILPKDITKKMLIQAGENLQCCLESAYTDTVKNGLLNCDDSFFEDGEEKLNFCLFLFSQYLRTQKKRDAVIESFKGTNCNDFALDPEKLWKVLIVIMSNMAAYNFLCNDNVHIKFIKSTKKHLLTSDQPVISFLENGETIEKFYFPISPEVGLIFPSLTNEVIVDDDKTIKQFNDLIVEQSVRFVIKYPC